MKKTITKLAAAAAVAALFISFSGRAQTTASGDSKNTRFGIGLNLGLPTTDGYNFAIGGDVRVQKDFSSNISGMLTGGYTRFSYDNELIPGNVGFIPIKVGVKIFPVERFYISGEAGVAFGTGNNDETSFVYAPGIGIGTNLGLDFGLRYEGFAANGGNIGQVALRIAYGFNLSK